MKLKSQSGSILLSTLSFVIFLAVAAASVLELTMNSYRLTMRNEVRAQARAVAESEMESIFYQWVTQIMSAVPAADTPVALSALATPGDVPDYAAGAKPAFLAAHRAQNWEIYRSIGYNPTYDFFDGMIPKIKQLGKASFVTVRIEVRAGPNSPFHNEAPVRVGRRFSTTTASIFQYGVFYQGDLEMAPGNDITIDGDVVANGSVYMASTNPGHLTLNKYVKYLSSGYFNTDSLYNTSLRKPNTPVGGTLIAPIFLTSQASQVVPMTEPANLLGGIDAAALSSSRSDLFPTENDVYRAAILPPPDQTDEYPTADSLQGDDPVINVGRMYTRAGLRITVNADNTVSFTMGDGTAVTSIYNVSNIVDTSLPITDPLRNLGPIVVGSPNSNFYDLREVKNVPMTTINMHALMVAINQNYPTGSGDFNGAIYINLRTSDITVPHGVQLINGQDVTGRRGLGTTVTTNGGLYVKGDYNTASAPLSDGSTNPAMLMGDQITALSAGWNDANAVNGSPLGSRVASADITINAGILTGNTSATTTQASGGAQNLVRYLENWNGHNVTVFGSLGRLFESKTFHSYFQQPLTVYGKPASRNFRFDTSLLKHPPAGSPNTTSFERGSFFVWSR